MNPLELPWKQFAKDERAVFIYDLGQLRKRAQAVKQSLASWTKSPRVFYSVKSNPHPRILQCLLRELDGFDVSSELELALCLRLNIPGKRISVSGPGKTDECLQLTKSAGVDVLHVDSLDELVVAQELGLDRLSLRIHTPDIFSAKLGLQDTELLSALNRLKAPALGLHMYMGREAFTWARLTEATAKMQSWFQQQKTSFTKNPNFFVGPGIPGTWQTETFAELQSVAAPMTFEVGRGVVADCGSYAVPVLSRKLLDRGGEALIVHGGLQHLGSPFVSFAQKVDQIQVRVIRDGEWLNKTPEDSASQATSEFLIAGSLCLGHDILHPRLRLPKDVRRGDWLLFPRAGAYGLSAGVPFFIGQDLPKEVIFEDGKFEDVTLQDFKLYQESFERPLKGSP